jgi:alkanesulfonate monooxygenase SsuD/methylene tetrahydromethanopterin reductase-like flavin-dependent oxidoreductase (luciferase family)
VTVRIGMTLPSFVPGIEPALGAARVADAGGLDGVFVFDHLWPMGAPGRPALWSFGVLGAVAAITRQVVVGPLVARVGLLGEEDEMGAFRSLAAVAGRSRVIAGLGAGDHQSRPENMAYGVPYPRAADRLRAVERIATRLAADGMTVWVGGASAESGAVAARAGVGRNLWAATAEDITQARRGLGHVPLTWGGQVLIGRDRADLTALRARHGDRPGLVAGTVDEVAAALVGLGADWCVVAPLDYLVQPERAAETVCLVREAVQ